MAKLVGFRLLKSSGILKVRLSVVVVPASHIYVLCFTDTISFEYTCKTAHTAVLLAYYKLSVFHH